MSRYRIVGNEDGWSNPIYADEYGNIVSNQEVEIERLKERIMRETKTSNVIYDYPLDKEKAEQIQKDKWQQIRVYLGIEKAE